MHKRLKVVKEFDFYLTELEDADIEVPKDVKAYVKKRKYIEGEFDKSFGGHLNKKKFKQVS